MENDQTTLMQHQAATILTARVALNKSYWIEDGRIAKSDYRPALLFNSESIKISSIHKLWETLHNISGNSRQCLIRGVPDWEFATWAVDNPDAEYGKSRNGDPKYCRDLIRGPAKFPRLRGTKRRLKIFREPEGGNSWVMLDFDGLEIPESVGSPNALNAIEWVIDSRLPDAFSNVSFVYQHSNSSGLLEPDGTPYRAGLNAHLFFCFDRGVKNRNLKLWLKDCPVDKAVFNPVQPHYVAAPTITGIKCVLGQRQGLVTKGQDVVQVPDFVPPRAGDGQLELL